MENARPCPLWVLLVMLITMLVSSPELGAQAIGPDGVCEVGRVTNIVVDNRPIFQLETLEEDSPLRWVYWPGKALPITTRQSLTPREI